MGCCGCRIPENAGLKKRKGLTDSLCVVFFMACVVGWACIGIVAFFLGSPVRYWNGFDSFGNTCDTEPNRQLRIENLTWSGMNTTGLKNVMYFDKIGQSSKSLSLCVRDCPVPLNNATSISTITEFIEYSMRTGNKLCHYSISLNDYNWLTPANFSSQGPCPNLPIHKSIELINRCVPLTPTTQPIRLSLTSTEFSQLQSYITGTLVDLLFEFLNQAYSNEIAIGVACVSAIVLSIFMMLMMHCLAYVFTYFILFGVILGTFALAALSWIAYANDYRFPAAIPIPSFVDTHTVFLALGIICTCAALLILFLVIFLWRRILLVCAIFREITRCLSDEPAMLLLPFKQIFLIGGWLVVSLVVFFSMFTTDNHSINSSGFIEFSPNEMFRYLIIVHSIMVVWMFFFIIGIQNMVTAAATTVWYFTPKKSRNKSSALLVGSHLAWCYHIGSVAFASIIHALFFILLMALRLLTIVAKKKNGKDGNKAVNCILRCLQCFVACCWRFYNMINDYAYAFIAMYGKNFCSAANMAFNHVVRHPLHIASIASIGSACILLCRILVASATTACTELYLIHIVGKTAEETWFCAVLIFCVSFLIASVTFDLYSDMLHSLFVCFVRDTEDNDGTVDRPFYMSRALMKFIDDVNNKVYSDDFEPMSWGTIARENSPLNTIPPTVGSSVYSSEAGDRYDAETLLSKYQNGHFMRD